MQLPISLQQAIEKEIAPLKASDLLKARKELTERYHKETDGALMQTDAQRLSYLVTRLPATFAVISQVLSNFLRQMPTFKVQSFLDLGAGPGGALWAVLEKFPHLSFATLMEKDAKMVLLAQKLAPAFVAQWYVEDLEKKEKFPLHDLVLFSYSLAEIKKESRKALLTSAFAAAQVLIVIEPGTPKGFETILEARETLISARGHMVAPCPHTLPCPLQETKDWCHFSTRIERTSLHRQLKQAELGYEDEKFSYMIFSKREATLCKARILRHPLKRSGHVRFSLCTTDGLREEVVSKKNDTYKEAKNLEWGDCFE